MEWLDGEINGNCLLFADALHDSSGDVHGGHVCFDLADLHFLSVKHSSGECG